MISFIRFFHLPYLTVSVRKMSYKKLNFCIFHNLMHFKSLSVCLAQIYVTKFPKWKIWDVYFLHFSMLIVINYFFLSYPTIYGQKKAYKMGNFHIFHKFIIFENLSTCFAKICAMKFQKSKIWDVHFFSFFHADRHEIFFISHIQMFLVEKWPRKWAIFLFFVISWFLKISQLVLQISLWRIFKNQKSEMCIFFVFSCWSSWDNFDLPYLTFPAGKLA